MKSIKTENYTWIHLQNPKADDLERVQKLFKLHPIVLGELNSPTYRPRINSYDGYTFMVLHFPLYNRKERQISMGEVDILINDEYLVTNCNQKLPALNDYLNLQIRQQSLPTHVMPNNPYLLLFKLMDVLFNSCFPMLDKLSQNLEAIEDEIFKGNEKKMVKEISIIKRNILNFRRIIQPQRSILESFLTKKEFTENVDYHIRINDILGNHIRIWNVLENHKETIDSLEATNDSLFSHKINEAIKALTIISVMVLPASLTAGLLGMNVELFTQKFWMILSVVACMILCMLLLVLRKRWL